MRTKSFMPFVAILILAAMLNPWSSVAVASAESGCTQTASESAIFQQDVSAQSSAGVVCLEATAVASEELRKKLIELSSQDVARLMDAGYSGVQAFALTNLDATQLTVGAFDSEILPQGIFADVTFVVTYVGYSSSKYTFKYHWIWDGKPLVCSKDGIGFAWDQGFRVSSSDISAYVTYVDGNKAGTVAMASGTAQKQITAGAGWGSEFNVMAGPSNTAPAWAKSGYGTFKLTNPNMSRSIQMVWEYGHAYISLGSIGINITATPSVSFVKAVEVMVTTDHIWEV